MRERPGAGKTLIEKLEHEAGSAAFAFAILTPDDIVLFPDQEYAQARPNVLFELGYFYGRITRARTCVLLKAGTKIHSDLEGINRIEFRTSVEEVIGEIELELREAGLLRREEHA